MAATAPTALVSWSHTDPGWDDARRTRRAELVRAFADTLRASGVDCEVDLYHSNEGVDWTRWGPRLIDDQDYVLVVASHSWRAAWEGRGDPTRGAGAAAEADALRSLYARDRDEFVRRVRLIMLPGASRDDIPSGLDGVTRYEVSPSDGVGVAELVRDLTGQPRFRPAPLGPVPVLPPEPGAVPSGTLKRSDSAAAQGVSYGALPGELGFRWRSQWDPYAGSGSSSLTVHCLRLPARAVPMRDVLGFGTQIQTELRSSGVVPHDAALHLSEDENGATVMVDQPQRRYDEVSRGDVLGVRLDRNGQASVWRSLPRDQMGAVLDPAALEDDVAECFGLVAHLWQAGDAELAIAIELNSVMLITEGVVGDLGRRNQATMTGAMREDVHVEPDETVRTIDFFRDRRMIAADVVPIVLRKWRLV